MDYTVSASDTLERIAASHDCAVGELMKLNSMSSRMVFPGQKIIVPVPSSDDVFEQANQGVARVHQPSSILHSLDGIRRGPGGAVPAQKSTSRTGSMPSGSTEETDSDCLQRILKIKVKQVTELDETVSGTLLVTPNCLMFDPDVMNPLVKEKGQDLYGMVANLDEIVAVSVYKEITGLAGDRADKKKDIFDPSHARTAMPSLPSVDVVPDDTVQEKVSLTCEPLDSEEYDSAADEQGDSHSASSKRGSELQLPAISEENRAAGVDSPEDSERKRAVSDVTNGKFSDIVRSRSPSSSRSDERPRSFSELDAPQPPQGISRFSPNAARRSFGKLGRILSERAKSVHSCVTHSAERVAQTAVQGTKSVAHGVVTHTRSAADFLQTGLETSVKVVGEAGKAAANQAKTAADAFAAVPGRVVDSGTNLVSDGINGMQEMFAVEEQRSASQMKREQSLATLEGLKLRTQQARYDARNKSGIFSCATSTDDMPDLFTPIEQLINRDTPSGTEAGSPVLPYYMAVRLTRKRKPKKSSPSASTSVSSYDEDVAFGNKLKREFWFAIPRNKADNIYSFLLQWSPEKYGKDTTISTLEESTVSSPPVEPSRERGFIILDSTTDESLAVNGKETNVAMPSFEGDIGDEDLDRFSVINFTHPSSLGKATAHHFGTPAVPEKSYVDCLRVSHMTKEWKRQEKERVKNAAHRNLRKKREFCPLDEEDRVQRKHARREKSRAKKERAEEQAAIAAAWQKDWDARHPILPIGAASSLILDELMIIKILEILPPRAEGYPWVNIYSSEKHGSSLSTLYGRMIEFDEDLSPVLLIIRDTNEHVFGAVVSGAIRPSDHYTGTGDSCLLWRFTGVAPHTRELRQYSWTGDNQFFVSAAKDSLSVGAGGGHYGVWLDADLNHGRSQRCDTFGNEPLAGEHEDFIVKNVEAYGFRM